MASVRGQRMTVAPTHVLVSEVAPEIAALTPGPQETLHPPEIEPCSPAAQRSPGLMRILGSPAAASSATRGALQAQLNPCWRHAS